MTKWVGCLRIAWLRRSAQTDALVNFRGLDSDGRPMVGPPVTHLCICSCLSLGGDVCGDSSDRDGGDRDDDDGDGD
eukprot:4701603-Pyramimonas_sp.AAC.1